MVQKLEKCQKITKDHNFVKNMTIKNPKSHAHLQIMVKHSPKFQINSRCSRSCREKVRVSKGHNSTKNDQNKNQKPHAHLFKLIRPKNVGDAGTRFRMDGKTDGHTQGLTRVISIVPLCLRPGDKKDRHDCFGSQSNKKERLHTYIPT